MRLTTYSTSVAWSCTLEAGTSSTLHRLDRKMAKLRVLSRLPSIEIPHSRPSRFIPQRPTLG